MKEALSALILLAALAQGQESRVVDLAQGPVRGYKGKGDYFAFYSIPYATAPTGEHKFKAPMPGPTWTETFEAVNKNIVCPQNMNMMHIFGFKDVQMKEDCLIANVFVPETKETNLPVLVIVHGGAYQMGSGNMLQPVSLVTEGNIIAVTFNYRLSVHGFLCLGTEVAPGNAGMKDMVALLRWVKVNIASFGGNPNDVTIEGCSAGSSAVDHLLLSETTKGLFHKVIPESGTALGPWGVTQDPFESAMLFAKKNNFTGKNIYDLETFYQTTPLDILTLDLFMDNKDSSFEFVPCVERDTGVERFLKEAPYNIMKNGNYEKLPVLIGFAEHEGMFRLTHFDLWKDRMNEYFSDFLPADLKFKDKKEKEEVAAKIKKFYFGDKPISDETVKEFVDFFSDIIFGIPTVRSVNLQAKAGSDSVFLYEYSFHDNTTTFKVEGMTPSIDFEGANHGTQMFAIYDFFPLPPASKDFEEVKKTMRQFWINFIKTGRPVPLGSPLIPWHPVSADNSRYMSMNKKFELKSNLLGERARFWDSIYAEHNLVPIAPPAPPKKNTEL